MMDSALLSLLVFGTAKYGWLLRSAFVALMFSSVTEIALVYQQVRQRAAFFVIFSRGISAGATPASTVTPPLVVDVVSLINSKGVLMSIME